MTSITNPQTNADLVSEQKVDPSHFQCVLILDPVTSLGTRVFENTTYTRNGKKAIADLAPLALMELFDKLGLSIPDRF